MPVPELPETVPDSRRLRHPSGTHTPSPRGFPYPKERLLPDRAVALQGWHNRQPRAGYKTFAVHQQHNPPPVPVIEKPRARPRRQGAEQCWWELEGNVALVGASQVPVGVAQHAPPVPGLIPQLAGVAVAEPPPEGAEEGPREPDELPPPPREPDECPQEPELPPPPPGPLGGEDGLGTMTEANASNFSVWAGCN